MKLANLGEEIVERSRDKERKTSKGIKMMRENSAFQTDMYIFVCLYILMYIYIYIFTQFLIRIRPSFGVSEKSK